MVTDFQRKSSKLQCSGEQTGVFWIQKCSIIQKPYGATLGTVHYLYPRGVGDSYVIYKNLVALPPLDDLNVEDPPPIKY